MRMVSMTGTIKKRSACLWLALFTVAALCAGMTKENVSAKKGWMIRKEAAKVEDAADKEERELTAGLHAKAAVLLDMDSGRVLYEKNGSEILPMASTTKIMTCILALENCNMQEEVTVSAYAVAQPKVHLGMKKGEHYLLGDLLYSLMLESHNDSAVAIAEHIGGKELSLPPQEERTKEQSREAVLAFCNKMTKKALELGCKNTCFLTPNGLDAQTTLPNGQKKIHATTAEDLAAIMRYCVVQSEQKDTFLKITRAQNYTFSDAEKKRSHSCCNHNAFLPMMDGALSGKTGFTNQAGYCYVGALARDEKKLAIALLACGWPGHKTWKWADAKSLFRYGLSQYHYEETQPEVTLPEIPVLEAASPDGNPYRQVVLTPAREDGILPIRLLLKEGETVSADMKLEKELHAPFGKKKQIGRIDYFLTTPDGAQMLLASERLYTGVEVKKAAYPYFFSYILKKFLVS